MDALRPRGAVALLGLALGALTLSGCGASSSAQQVVAPLSSDSNYLETGGNRGTGPDQTFIRFGDGSALVLTFTYIDGAGNQHCFVLADDVGQPVGGYGGLPVGDWPWGKTEAYGAWHVGKNGKRWRFHRFVSDRPGSGALDFSLAAAHCAGSAYATRRG
jgi:hypothetical protein